MKLGISLGALAGLQLLASLALQLVVLRLVGAGALTDAYMAAQTLPILLVAVLATPLQALWQPRLAVAASGRAQWRAQQGLAQTQVLWLVGGTALAAAASAPQWLPRLFPGLPVSTHSVAVDITRVLCVGALLNSHALLLTVALRAQERLVIAEVVTTAGALAAVAAAVSLVPQTGVMGAAYIGAARAAVVCAVLYFLADRPLLASARALSAGNAWHPLRPLLTGTSIYKLSPLVDRYWGSLAPVGGLTLLTLSQTGIGAVAQMVERAVCMPVTPQLARLAQGAQYGQMRALIRDRITRVTLIVGMALLMLVLVRPAWPAALNSALHLSEASAVQMWWICLLLLGYLHVAAAGALPMAAFIALGDSRTPVRIGVIGFVVGIGLKSVGFVVAGLPGLALATSLYYAANLLVMWRVLESRLEARIA